MGTLIEITKAAAHVGEAIRLLRRVDPEKFDDTTRKLQQLVTDIERFATQES